MIEKTGSASAETVECRLVGDFVELNARAGSANAARSQPSPGVVGHPDVLLRFLDVGSSRARREFSVLLRDDRIVKVKGDSVRFVQNASNSQDTGSQDTGWYEIVAKRGDDEVLIGIFRASEITGIFDGTIGLSGSQ